MERERDREGEPRATKAAASGREGEEEKGPGADEKELAPCWLQVEEVRESEKYLHQTGREQL